MFQHFSEFIESIESLPPLEITFRQREALLEEAKAFIRAQGLVPQIPVVTVTGTNGKGSTVKALSEILVHQGLNVCAFTSPHLLSYTERFSYNLRSADEETLLRLANKLLTLIDFSHWNFFFILFFIQLLLCQELRPDCLILEVGIGGRLDPTNTLDASLVILTQVALDHAEILGDTREEIGLEKMGLLRKGIPFICGDPHPPLTVIEKAKALDCKRYQIKEQFGFKVRENQWDLWQEGMMCCGLPPPKLHLMSLSCAFQAAKVLFPARPFTQAFMEKKLPEVYLAGRYQQLVYEGMEFVVDVSHNPAAVEALAKFLRLLPSKQTIAIFGIKASKDIVGILNLMKDVIAEWYVVPIAAPSGMAAKALVPFFESQAIQPNIALNVEDAIRKIAEKKIPHARVVAFGSFRVAGPALALIGAV